MIQSFSAYEVRFIRWIRTYESIYLTRFFQICTFLGTPIGWVIISIAFCLYHAAIDWGFRIGLMALIGGMTAELIKHIFRRKRPCFEKEAPSAYTSIPYTHSFPSGHACSAFSVASMLVLIEHPLMWVLFIFAACVGFSRIYLGVHYPSDVVVGAFLGFLCAMMTHSLWHY